CQLGFLVVLAMLLGDEPSRRHQHERQTQQVGEQDLGSIPRLSLSAESREKAELVNVIHQDHER
ncbi:hypothetical protein OFC87_37985, partial [Escherichia coli]|nr:hypothetical protein [Escherichia coli]